MSRRPLQYPVFQAFASDETFLEGGTVTFYDAGTTTKRNIYQDIGLTTPAPNPVTLNARGEPQSSGGTPIDIYLDANPYKIVLKDSSGTTIHTTDDFIIDGVENITEPKDPIDASDTGTDTYEADLNRDPLSGESFVADFQSANTTTTPTFENTSGSLGALTMKTRRGEALWANAIQGEHRLYYDGTDYLVLDPSTQPLSETSDVTFDGVTITGDLSATGDVDFTGTGSVQIPVGTTAQRPGTPTEGDIRRNTTTGQFEGYTGTEWGPFGGGATGGGSDQVFVQNDQTVTEDYTIPADKNAMTTGPITVASGVTVTVASGARWVVI